MLLAFTLRNFRQFTPAHTLFFQPSLRINQLTPISSHHHFLRTTDDETAKRKTGFVYTKHQLDLHRAIHSRSALCLKYSNSLGQKVEKNETKIEEKKIPVQEVTLDVLEAGKKLGLFARFKKMAKEYWYVLIPVHVVTSTVWLGIFFYTSKRWKFEISHENYATILFVSVALTSSVSSSSTTSARLWSNRCGILT